MLAIFSRRGLAGRGFSLIEMLIAMAILSIGLGGVSLMMLTAVRGTVEARNQTVAGLQAASLAELIIMNPGSLGHFIDPVGATAGCLAFDSCADAGWVAASFEQWQTELQDSLAGARGIVCRDASPDDGSLAAANCDGQGVAVVKVFWSEPHRGDDERQGMRRMVLPVID